MKHILKVSKPKLITTCALLCLFFAATLSSQAQISLSLKQTTVGEALKSIQRQGEYHFFYDDNLADLQIAEIQVKNKSLKETLDTLLSGKNVSYTIEDNVVYFSTKKTETPKADPQAGKLTVTGKVVDENGEPLIGVSVVAKGTAFGTSTDLEGNYLLTGLSANSQLQFSYIGYLMQTLTVGNRTVVDVTLTEDAKQ
ncbi:MAG: carboxypeptidase-like regulatory domain-containing protein, partial [Candidatus Symbiothrix sp.]|nr:carboxypeptidase-like regulatory domain-containing protein [Candidatus Symbiothrix sp.]